MIDLLTGEEFEPKRSWQKFATSENRIKYNNQCAKKIRKEKSILDKPLYQNYKILCELMKGKREAIFHQQFLLGKGFNFSTHNRIQEYDSKNYYCVYQYIMIHEKENTKFIYDDRYEKLSSD